MIYEVRYYFFGVPKHKHYGSKTFNKLADAVDFAYRLDDCHVECFEIRSISILHEQCISDKYCSQTTQCKRCKYKREDIKYG